MKYMVEVALLAYESVENIQTSDKFTLKIKASVEYELNSEDGLTIALDQISMEFFKNLSLFESMSLIEHKDSDQIKIFNQNITESCKNSGFIISKFTMTTIEGLRLEKQPQINIDIIPELEVKKKKTGLKGRFFGKK